MPISQNLKQIENLCPVQTPSRVYLSPHINLIDNALNPSMRPMSGLEGLTKNTKASPFASIEQTYYVRRIPIIHIPNAPSSFSLSLSLASLNPVSKASVWETNPEKERPSVAVSMLQCQDKNNIINGFRDLRSILTQITQEDLPRGFTAT